MWIFFGSNTVCFWHNPISYGHKYEYYKTHIYAEYETTVHNISHIRTKMWKQENLKQNYIFRITLNSAVGAKTWIIHGGQFETPTQHSPQRMKKNHDSHCM